jgi:ComF family protein
MISTLLSAGRSLAHGLLHLLYPNLCWVCGKGLSPEDISFCATCVKELTDDPFPTCQRCSSTVGPHVPLERGCSQCRDEDFRFDAAIRLGRYQGVLRELILRIKYGGAEELAEAVGRLWALHQETKLRAAAADVVIPVPLHFVRYFQRGFNQSEALAWGLADSLNLPCRPGWLRRVRNTSQQTQQSSPTARRENVRGAFKAAASARLESKTVLLVDDVLTTGSTASEAARALRVCRPARIVVAVLGHGS